MKKWQKIVFGIFWSIAATALLVLFVVSWKAKSEKQLTDIQIELVGERAKALFMDEIAIRAIMHDRGVQVGMPIEKINLTQLEHFIEKTVWIKNAEFFVNNNLVLEVKIEQRIPIARIFTASGASFYIDKEGIRLPLKQLTVLNLPVFTGFPTDQPKLSKPDSVLLKDVLFFAKTLQKDSFFMAQVAQINIEPTGSFVMVPTLGDHLVLLGTVDQLEDKLNRLFTFYKKVWLGAGVNAYQFIDCRFNHQIVALKKGMQPIVFTGDFKLLTGETSLLMQAPEVNSDSTIKASPVLIDSSNPSLKVIQASPAKLANSQLAKSTNTSGSSKKKVQVKGNKSKPKKNNKSNNNSFINKNKTAKALMPKKPKSPTKNN